jgi:hypothetical protein
MARKPINIGISPNDRTGDPLRTAFGKINDNFVEIYDAADRIPTDISELSDSTGIIPSLSTVATSGAYDDLSGTPALATVATSGAYTDLSGAPALATVATTGAYSDLSGRPTLGTAAAADTSAFATSAQGALADSAVQPAAIAKMVVSDTTGITGAAAITNIVSLTQAAYDALATKDAATLYAITS